jgi:molybdopterin/thiamine biosynthesis adenylyltransferase
MQRKLDENRYSRQIGAYGADTMAKLIKLRVLIVGLRGLGVEVAKNLVLAGPAAVTLHDESIVAIEDLGANFFLRPADVGVARRAPSVVRHLSELNSEVTVLSSRQWLAAAGMRASMGVLLHGSFSVYAVQCVRQTLR